MCDAVYQRLTNGSQSYQTVESILVMVLIHQFTGEVSV